MLALFLGVLAVALSFSILFFITYPQDYKQKPKQIRPLYLLVLATGFWFFTLPALLTPYTVTTTYSAYNVITANVPLYCTLTSADCPTTNTLTQYPAYAVSVADTAPIPPQDVLAFTVLWTFVWGVHAILLVLYLIEWLKDMGLETIDELDK